MNVEYENYTQNKNKVVTLCLFFFFFSPLSCEIRSIKQARLLWQYLQDVSVLFFVVVADTIFCDTIFFLHFYLYFFGHFDDNNDDDDDDQMLMR